MATRRPRRKPWGRRLIGPLPTVTVFVVVAPPPCWIAAKDCESSEPRCDAWSKLSARCWAVGVVAAGPPTPGVATAVGISTRLLVLRRFGRGGRIGRPSEAQRCGSSRRRSTASQQNGRTRRRSWSGRRVRIRSRRRRGLRPCYRCVGGWRRVAACRRRGGAGCAALEIVDGRFDAGEKRFQGSGRLLSVRLVNLGGGHFRGGGRLGRGTVQLGVDGDAGMLEDLDDGGDGSDNVAGQLGR